MIDLLVNEWFLMDIETLLAARRVNRRICCLATRAINRHAKRRLCDENMEIHAEDPRTVSIGRKSLTRAILYRLDNTDAIFVYQVNLVTMVSIMVAIHTLVVPPPLPKYKDYLRKVPIARVPELCYGKFTQE